MDIEERFLKYVSIDTQSDEYSDTTPSTLQMLAELILNLKKSIIMMVLSSKSIKN